jgi:CRP-like cAMP-binding protein
LEQVLRLTPPAPSYVRPELPDHIDAIVLRMIQKSPGDRYANWAELALDLAHVGRLSVFDQAVHDSDKYTTLRNSPLLGALSDAEVWELARAGIWSRLPGQTALVREGEMGDSLFILGEGEAKVTFQGKLLDVLRKGDCFGEMAYVRGEAATRGATVETTTDALVAELPRAAVDALSVACQLHLTRALLRTMADRLAFANVRVSRAAS